jgi:DNA-binding NarL/FixJ family response regulator
VSEDPIRVLIADDQALMRTGFRMILDAQDDIEVVGEAIDGADAIRRFEALSPDVVVMDRGDAPDRGARAPGARADPDDVRPG